MAHDPHVEELIPFYLMGALDALDADTVEKHLPNCAHCRAVVNELRVGSEVLIFSAPPISPSPHIKDGLFARVQSDLDEKSNIAPRAGFFDWLLAPSRAIAFASVILLVLSVGYALSLRAQVNEQNATLALLSQPGAVTKEFKATAVQPNARGQLIADPNDNRALLIVNGLKPLPAGRVYEAWLIKGKTPVGVGTFVVDANGVGQILINAPEPLRVYQIAALTEEPEGGSALPTTSILMSSQFN